MTMRRLLLACLLLCLSFVALAQAVAPTASLDRASIDAGDTVTLNIELGDAAGDTPDLSPLMTDFVVLGTSTNRSLSVVNGRREAHTILGIALRPRHEGHLTVPALAIGGQRTQPLTLDVSPAGNASNAPADRPVVLEAKTDPVQAYVGQQIDYTLRLYFAVNLADGQLDDPSAEGAEIRRVGQDANFQTTRGGRRFNVVERHYAIFPQHAGPLEIHPPSFQGTAVDASDASAFFGTGSPVNAVAERSIVQVRPRPASATGGAWIPARELTLALDGLPADGKARVGQPMTLTMRVDATGMPFEALPALSLPTLDGADVYPDKAVTGGGASGPWITGRRQQGFAVVPTRPGTLHIPATTLHWWNVVTDTAQVATLPARDIEVSPAAGSAAAPAGTPPAAAANAPSAGSAASTPPPSLPASGVPWPWLFVGACVLWLLTVVAWFVMRRRKPGAPPSARPAAAAPTRERPAREAFLKAAAHAESAAIERALLAWAASAQPSARTLGALSALLAPGPQPAAIAQLQRARFAGAEADRDGLRQAFVDGFAWKAAPRGGDSTVLPPLYPR
jgi:hypothetical protein